MTSTARTRVLMAAAAALVVVALLALPGMMTSLASRAIKSRAAAQGWDASWREMRVSFPATLRVSNFTLQERDGGVLGAVT